MYDIARQYDDPLDGAADQGGGGGGGVVFRTHSYVDAVYGVANDVGLVFGESTCASRFVSRPVGFDRDGETGHALLDMAGVSKIALAWCVSARCACHVMGQLTETYGFYGESPFATELRTLQQEGGEAISVVDKEEAWMFHLTSDPSGTSSLWAAQRVPEGHVAAASNQFVLREIDLTDPDNFMGSSNLAAVRKAQGVWNKDQSAVVPYEGCSVGLGAQGQGQGQG